MPGVHKSGRPCGTLIYVVRPFLNGNAFVFTRQLIHMRRAILCKAGAGAIYSNGSEPLDAFKCKSALGRHRLSTVKCLRRLRDFKAFQRYGNVGLRSSSHLGFFCTDVPPSRGEATTLRL